MSSTLRKPPKPANKTTNLGSPTVQRRLTRTEEETPEPQVSSIEQHTNILGAPKNIYSSRNYTSTEEEDNGELGMAFEEVAIPEEPLEEAATITTSLREYSPKKLVVGLNEDTRSADEYLSSLQLQVQYTIEADKANYILVKDKNKHYFYVRVPKTRRVYNSLRSTSPRRSPIQTRQRYEKSSYTPYTTIVRNATLKVCQPECVGVVFAAPHTGVTTFVEQNGFESFLVTDGVLTQTPLPIVEFDDITAHAQEVLQSLTRVQQRLENHLLTECDDHVESLVQLYNDLHKTLVKFVSVCDDAFETCNNSTQRSAACEQLTTACVNIPEILDRLQSAHEILQMSVSALKN